MTRCCSPSHLPSRVDGEKCSSRRSGREKMLRAGFSHFVGNRGATGPAIVSAVASRWQTTIRSTSTSSRTAPLFQLDRALYPDLHAESSPLTLTIRDEPSELWAVLSPRSSSSSGSRLLSRLLSTLASLSRPQQEQQQQGSLDTSQPQKTKLHPSPHAFTKDPRLIALASFSKQQVTSNSEFQDFSARYGALREEDTITVFESLMDAQGFEVGKIAALKVLPDKLKDVDAVEPDEREKALEAKARIEKLAPLLGLHKPGPGSEGGQPLLYSPVISLSNGQLRRARIVSSLVKLDEASSERSESPSSSTSSLLILDQPYSGLDDVSRTELTTLLAKLHAAGTPRVVLVLRRQDELPNTVTHIIDIDTDGKVWAGRRDEWQGDGSKVPRGVEGIRENSQRGVGVGSGEELARLNGIKVQYGDKIVLDAVDLTIREGSRLIVKGSNGSGKTTLLSLLNGSHPQSYSFSPDQYTLFGKPRMAPSNASRLLSRRIGYFGPDLLVSFPRRGKESGGLSIKDAVACGFSGVFSQVDITDQQEQAVEQLLSHFKPCLSYREQGARIRDNNDNDEAWWDRSFIELDAGSQAVVLFLRAVVNRPAIVILDEPFQGMDVVQIDRLRSFIDSLGAEGSFLLGETEEARTQDQIKAGKTAVVLVSHYINEWPESMGEYMLLDNGRVVEQV